MTSRAISLEIDVGRRGDFAGDDDQAGGDQGLAGHAALGILVQDGVEDGVGNLVGNLVGMTLGDRLRGKEETLVCRRQNTTLRRIGSKVEAKRR